MEPWSSPGLLLPAGVVESLEGSEVPPRGRQPVLQELPAALARSLEQLYVTPQPGLKGEGREVKENWIGMFPLLIILVQG